MAQADHKTELILNPLTSFAQGWFYANHIQGILKWLGHF